MVTNCNHTVTAPQHDMTHDVVVNSALNNMGSETLTVLTTVNDQRGDLRRYSIIIVSRTMLLVVLEIWVKYILLRCLIMDTVFTRDIVTTRRQTVGIFQLRGNLWYQLLFDMKQLIREYRFTRLLLEHYLIGKAPLITS